ncbi:prephenate dehydratase [Zhongshania aliphaticivorans]|uniref:prephenate dehydratase n=1 Tax=Zhongshania aliphaticivorans TaxID=1470434 RepID=UPI0012E513DD|nr:prephenate dehydratase [Zhongshania aliphaticivorans]MBU0538877.1 prephenate dehydratase [Gammaproteobacteria bacterium]MBU1831966.1 prephenate dehydratase [Gammaproteobacteria bacterium]CAA0082841.1 Prephenate dehydratase [Zhongshania aliphaticivorans]
MSDSNTPPVSLDDLRQSIDSIDTQIHDLLNRRASCAQQVAEVKLREFAAAQQFESNADSSSSQQLLFYRPEREAQVLARVKAANKGPLADDTVAFIFREIMSACLALEKPMEVAYLGPMGTFSQAAALKHFGHAVVSVPQASIDEVFAKVVNGQCHYGVVPVENSTEGMVSHTLDAFINSPLKICGELELRIRLHLLVGKDGKDKPITRICAHQQALAQSRRWLDAHFPGVERAAVSSNGEAARMAAEEEGVAAVAGDMAEQQYGLVQLAANIEDQPDNTTRFLIIGREDVAASGRDKTSLVVSARNRPGALFKLLEPFQKADVMLTRIDTRPSRTEPWTYVFFIEFEGHRDDAIIVDILNDIEQHSIMFKVLGSYPKAAI